VRRVRALRNGALRVIGTTRVFPLLLRSVGVLLTVIAASVEVDVVPLEQAHPMLHLYVHLLAETGTRAHSEALEDADFEVKRGFARATKASSSI
jgi:hypothetical protein